jgi:hypothetical protein|nr:MAG TPA: protein of unknown function (DUF5361) [Caudoviricetes sp.]
MAHHVAVEGELIRRGLRIRDLGSERFTWSDLKAVIYTADPGSHLAAVLGAPWGVADYMMANVIDLLNAGNWQRGGNKNSPKPKPVPRPGDKDESVKRFGADPIAPEAFDEWWTNG